ncbi:paraquat-inducible protein A [Paracoccaceae bacterium GXU_MW_L88]
MTGDSEFCPRCGNKVESRHDRAFQRLWAWWFAGLIMYIPANLYPMLIMHQLGRDSGATIVEGVIEFWHYGDYAIAAIIGIASVAVPVGKFIVIAILALSVQRGWDMRHEGRLKIYHIVEYIGRWSMIDVFVVAITAALVQFGALVNASPGIAAIFFALSVIFTMLSAQAFDSRTMWDAEWEKNT